MGFTIHDQVRLRVDLERAGWEDASIRAEIKRQIHAKPERPKTMRLVAPSVPRSATVAKVTPQSRIDRTVVGGYRMGPGFCGMCADVHPDGQHTL